MTRAEKEKRETFYFTFGQKYHREDHPLFGSSCDPEGWVEVRNATFMSSRDVMHHLMGPAWGFQYGKDTFKESYHPNGCFYVIHLNDDGTINDHYFTSSRPPLDAIKRAGAGYEWECPTCAEYHYDTGREDIEHVVLNHQCPLKEAS